MESYVSFFSCECAQVEEPTRAPYLGKARAQRVRAADGEHKCLGVKGQSMFKGLSYFKFAATYLVHMRT